VSSGSMNAVAFAAFVVRNAKAGTRNAVSLTPTFPCTACFRKNFVRHKRRSISGSFYRSVKQEGSRPARRIDGLREFLAL
jgi:hypothetical protein